MQGTAGTRLEPVEVQQPAGTPGTLGTWKPLELEELGELGEPQGTVSTNYYIIRYKLY